jgi:peptidoglycan hydrolase-like protein with peptidoglycan-binding domain
MMTKAAKKELQFPGDIKRGDKNAAVRRMQEWLCFHDFHVGIDDGFGPATESAGKQFQAAKGVNPPTGVMNKATFDQLVQPMVNALQDIPAKGISLGDLVVPYAKQHLAQKQGSSILV